MKYTLNTELRGAIEVLVIRNNRGDVTFTLGAHDGAFAEETLANLNAVA